MKPCFIKISSKNKSSILKFSFLIFKKFNFKIGPKIILKNYLKTKKRKKIFTILKSPHVNKKAQEQFEIRVFSQQLAIYTTYDAGFIYFLKNLKLRLFPDIKLKIEFSINKNNSLKITAFDIHNYKFQSYKFDFNQNTIVQKIVNTNKNLTFQQKKNLIQQIQYKNNFNKSTAYLNVLGIYGELVLKKFSLHMTGYD